MDRRRFLTRVWVALGLAAVAEAVWVVASFLRPRAATNDQSAVMEAGRLERFEAGSVTAFPAAKLYVVRLPDGGFLALHRECTHLGCTVPWDDAQRRFACPCHASSFDIAGRVVGPPAPRPLDFYPVRVENGVVKVDTARRTRRDTFDASQVTLP